MTHSDRRSVIESDSPFTFEKTVNQLSVAISNAGMKVFALIDHAANARAVGLSVPATIILIYGKTEGGPPVMLASP